MNFMKNSIRKQLFIQVMGIILLCVFIILILNSELLGKVYIFNEKKNLVKIAAMVDNLDFSADNFYTELCEVVDEYNLDIKLISENGSFVYFSAFNGLYSGNAETGAFPFGDSVRIFEGENGGKPLQQPAEDTGDPVANEFEAKKHNPEAVADENNEIFNSLIIKLYDIEPGKLGVFSSRQSRNDGSRYLIYSATLDNGYNIELSIKKTAIENNAVLANNLIFIIAMGVSVAALFMVLFYSKQFAKPLVEMNDITRNMAKMDFSKKCTTRRSDEIGQLGSSINLLSDSLALTLNDLKEKNIQLEKDIEFERKQETVRKEFISNVSHELKTPIAIIQGYAEGLQTGVADSPEAINEYCAVITEEAQKMNRMVISLLELSKYEFGAYELHPESFEIKKFVCDYTNNMLLLFEEKHIKFTLDIPGGVYAWGDVEKLNMALNNFVSNALSHMSGERRLEISLEDTGGSYRIKVFNTGENVSRDDMENIWISFYRADKSHSRSQGRYGIGLSIVKAIQNLHNQGFGCENSGDGVTFWFDVQKNDI